MLTVRQQSLPPSVPGLSELWVTAATITLDGGLTSTYPRPRM